MTWNKIAAITLNNTILGLAGPDLSNYPIVFLGNAGLAHTDHGGYLTDSNGYDIRFTTDEAGTQVLDYELVPGTYVHTDGTGEWWIRIPTVDYDASQIIYVWAGNADISTNQSSTTTWGTNYKGVWHLPNGTTLTANDSTGVNNGTINGAVTATAAKIDGGAIASWATAVNIAVGTSSTLYSNNAGMTFSAWVKVYSTSAYSTMFGKNPYSTAGYSFAFPPYAPKKITFFNYNYAEYASTGAIADLTWAYVTVTVATGANNIKFYINGAFDSQATLATSFSGTDTSIAYIGRSGGEFHPLGGSIDEVRYSQTVRSADWIKADYIIQNNPTGYYSVGTWAAVGGGGGLSMAVAYDYYRRKRAA